MNISDASYKRISLAYLLSSNSVLKYVLPLSIFPIFEKRFFLTLLTFEVVYELAINEIITGIINNGILVQTKVTTPNATIKFEIIPDNEFISPFT